MVVSKRNNNNLNFSNINDITIQLIFFFINLKLICIFFFIFFQKLIKIFNLLYYIYLSLNNNKSLTNIIKC